ncbi:MAG: hypothetical protein RI947_54 [Candidatus Parcubacteria bacterium]|jgi:hypothetical protein
MEEIPQDIPLESTKTKLLALWFIIVSLVSILVVVGTLLLVMNTISYSVLPDDVMFVSLFLYGSMIVVFGYICVLGYKVSAAIHRLEFQAYRSARLLFLVNIVGSSINILLSIILKLGSVGIVTSLSSVIVNGILLYLLSSERRLFTKEGKQSLWKMSVAGVALLVVVSVTGLYLQVLTHQRKESAIRELDQKIANELAKQNAEPVVTKWTKYQNDVFHFQMDVPEGWTIKEYPPDTEFGQQSTLIAFSGDKPLSGNRFVALENAHTYIIVFPSTDTAGYDLFQRRMSLIGRDNFTHATLGGVPGVDSSLNISAEHAGYVYEFFMKLQTDEEYNFSYSSLSLKMKDSFKFTQ